jgi:hypothetical protein
MNVEAHRAIDADQKTIMGPYAEGRHLNTNKASVKKLHINFISHLGKIPEGTCHGTVTGLIDNMNGHHIIAEELMN